MEVVIYGGCLQAVLSHCPTDKGSRGGVDLGSVWGLFGPFSPVLPTSPPEKQKQKSGVLLAGPVLKWKDLNTWSLSVNNSFRGSLRCHIRLPSSVRELESV